MSEQPLFHSGHIFITPSMASFGHITFQVSNIASVALYESRRFNRLAVVLALMGLAAIAIAAGTFERSLNPSLIALAVGIGFIIAAVVVQSIWPSIEFKFTLRLSGGDTHDVVMTNDRTGAERLKTAIEEAFLARRS